LHWFVQNLSTAEKKKDGQLIKPSRPCSYGHAAKVLDIAAKVYVYYCGLPASAVAVRVLPWLHAAVDTGMMAGLNRRYSVGLHAKTIEGVDADEYARLQARVARDIPMCCARCSPISSSSSPILNCPPHDFGGRRAERETLG
jgi:hypothetical protein